MSKQEELIHYLSVNFSGDFESINSALDDDSAFIKEIKLKLQIVISSLLERDHTRLLDILYRIDVPEKDVSHSFSLGQVAKISEALADAIINRQLKKIEYRLQRRKPGEN